MSARSDGAGRRGTPRVSVALGTHNGARFLGEQLGSILAQTHPVREIVLSDDASTDETVALAERAVDAHRAAGGDVELRVLRNRPALGVTANFEQALRASTGDLVALADQDDVWRPDRVARAVEAFRSRPEVQLVASDAVLVDAEGEDLGSTLFATLGVDDALRRRIDGPGAFDELLRRNLLTGATMMVRRELVDRAEPFPASWVHDEWLAVVASVTGGIAVLPDRLIGYRQHGANQIGVTELGWSGRLAKLREPRGVRNARLLARAGDLAARLPAIAPDPSVAERLDGKLDHERVRSGLPRARLRRAAPVLREWRTGRYRSYGLGAQDVLRDLVQPS
ncbi:glycosyltransferase family 2 protein [Agromyces aurantiacus]|uniref:Glycosyltransferase family 2 protein n=1 Tax=Agromyces aurantiacus TaxID=165814 RepID=A0ABV9R7F7_9MICO|nr:glycosyltransferase family 2 protein [Agromyces aurantiacus]MBM7504179.1 glycosyltransferase involved in cell wall biosynthesis [Agromyces aurantiacus]